jgi:hypothetical protein
MVKAMADWSQIYFAFVLYVAWSAIIPQQVSDPNGHDNPKFRIYHTTHTRVLSHPSLRKLPRFPPGHPWQGRV